MVFQRRTQVTLEQSVEGLMVKGILTPHLLGRPAARAGLMPEILAAVLLRQLHTVRRSAVVFADPARLLTPLQQLAGIEPPLRT